MARGRKRHSYALSEDEIGTTFLKAGEPLGASEHGPALWEECLTAISDTIPGTGPKPAVRHLCKEYEIAEGEGWAEVDPSPTPVHAFWALDLYY